LGEVVWAFYELTTGNFPYPSIADFFYIMAYPFWLYAVIREVKTDFLSVRGKWFWPGVVGILIAAGITFYFGILKSYNIEATILENLIGVAYGLGDLMILVVGWLLISALQTVGLHVKEYLLISLAMLCAWAADLLYYSVFMEPYNNLVVPFRLMDVLWISWYLLMAYAFYLLSKEKASLE